jgi:hypothetical protein
MSLIVRRVRSQTYLAFLSAPRWIPRCLSASADVAEMAHLDKLGDVLEQLGHFDYSEGRMKR